MGVTQIYSMDADYKLLHDKSKIVEFYAIFSL